MVKEFMDAVDGQISMWTWISEEQEAYLTTIYCIRKNMKINIL